MTKNRHEEFIKLIRSAIVAPKVKAVAIDADSSCENESKEDSDMASALEKMFSDLFGPID